MLNLEASSHFIYKLLIMGHHSEDYHTAAETFCGTPAWNCYGSLIKGNNTATWLHAEFVEAGIERALIANAF